MRSVLSMVFIMEQLTVETESREACLTAQLRGWLDVYLVVSTYFRCCGWLCCDAAARRAVSKLLERSKSKLTEAVHACAVRCVRKKLVHARAAQRWRWCR